MDSQVRRAVLEKIEGVISDSSDVKEIVERLQSVPVTHKADFALGIALGRIYNSFHYQTRRTLKRNATEDEFGEFQEMVQKNVDAIRKSLSVQ
ncbi:MAG TPA: hypothetical protein VJP79_11990 [Nitrososphaera sp.]|nr:hypothetical protein [Nitrososphaera sp.]